MIEKASNKELDMILMGDLIYDYVVNESYMLIQFITLRLCMTCC